MVVDSARGLEIVRATYRNYLNGNFAVQYVGSVQECKQEKARLKQLEFDTEQENSRMSALFPEV
jgi:hypothetical protein